MKHLGRPLFMFAVHILNMHNTLGLLSKSDMLVLPIILIINVLPEITHSYGQISSWDTVTIPCKIGQRVEMDCIQPNEVTYKETQ